VRARGRRVRAGGFPGEERFVLSEAVISLFTSVVKVVEERQNARAILDTASLKDMTMKLRVPVTLAAMLCLAGCSSTAPTGSSYTHRDSLSGPDMDITLDNLLESAEDRSYLIWLNAVRIREGAWDARYYLEVRYEGASDAGFMEIGPGDNLVLTVDGQTLRFRGPGSGANRQSTNRQTYVENAVFEVKADDLRRISKAKEVKVQINGNRRRLYRDFKEDNFHKFRSFVLTHMGL
jgi:hypothetical protein